ncbi:MAG TPA: hypothetical protein VF535_12285 [Allosphingosinicella sp.]|jgi:hypothetical protein
MKALLLMAVGALSAGAAAPSSSLPLQALTEADVGADALKNSACYVHDGPAVLLVATKNNAIVNSDGDLLMLDRAGHRSFPAGGARYRGNMFEVVISPAAEEAEQGESGRTNRAAQIMVKAGKTTHSLNARWSCGSPA